jgi:hypothetical protein
MSKYGAQISGMFANLGSRSRAAAETARQALAGNRPRQSSSMNQYTSVLRDGALFGGLFAASLVVFVIFLLLVTINYTIYPIFSFSPNDNGLIPIPTASDREMAYTRVPASSDLSANFINVPATSYTMGADVYLSGSFMLAQIPRVILYRAMEPVTSGGTEDSLLSTYPETNFILWLHPVKNDLYVSVVTQGNGGRTAIETSEPIENVPVRKVFRVAIVFTPNFIEVYMNGKLVRSMVIEGGLLAVNETSNIYSSVKPIQQNVMLGNLSLWPRVLTAREISVNESAPKKDELFFFKKA